MWDDRAGGLQPLQAAALQPHALQPRPGLGVGRRLGQRLVGHLQLEEHRLLRGRRAASVGGLGDEAEAERRGGGLSQRQVTLQPR